MSSRLMLRVKLGAMMFFQYAAWGAWTPILGATLTARIPHITGVQIGTIYGVLWLACIITPFIGGQIVDRLMPSQVYLGLASVVMTVSAYMMATQQNFNTLTAWMWVWSIAFAPTVGIANSIAMYHLGKEGTSPATQERDFSVIRTAGTVGWIVAGLALTIYLRSHPIPKGTWAPYEEMYVAAAAALVLMIVAFLLPNTPPAKEAKDPWAFLKSFQLFTKVPGFLVFMIISFLISTEFQFYYVWSGPFMESGMNIPHELIALYKSIAQVAEIISLGLFTPISLKYLGMRKTLVIGALAWPLRYFIFAAYTKVPVWLVLFSMSFHGVGFAFVFVTSYIYIDRVAPKDIRGSAQSLFTLVTLGFGNALGTFFSGWLKDYPAITHTDSVTQASVVNWPLFFMIPAALTTACGLAFLFTFKEPKADAYTEEFVEEAPVEAPSVL